MALPFFYKEQVDTSQDVMLDEPTSKHVVQVLRMQNGANLQLTNGKGMLFTAEITDDNRKKCRIRILRERSVPPPSPEVSIAISITKNTSRFEWFLEKATEIGVRQIIPLVCERTEKTSFKADRLNNILVSAMLQSQQVWLPVLHEPVAFAKLVSGCGQQQKFIAHCIEEARRSLPDVNNTALASKIILIGPEGDFTPQEIALALEKHFIAVTLGNTRLRTETAGLVAATLLCNI